MKKNVWFWLPRILGLLFSVFLGLFSLDVFEMQAPPLQLLGGFLMHNIPAFIILITTIIAWKWERVGGLIFLAIGIAALFFFRGSFAFSAFLCAILALIGGLFLWDTRQRNPS